MKVRYIIMELILSVRVHEGGVVSLPRTTVGTDLILQAQQQLGVQFDINIMNCTIEGLTVHTNIKLSFKEALDLNVCKSSDIERIYIHTNILFEYVYQEVKCDRNIHTDVLRRVWVEWTVDEARLLSDLIGGNIVYSYVKKEDV